MAVPFFRTTFSVSPVDGPDFYGAVIRHQRSFGAHKHTQRCVTSCTDCEGASFRWKLQRFAKCSRKPIIIKGGKWNLWWPRSDAVACYVLSQYVAIIHYVLSQYVAIIQVFHGENDKPIYKPLGLGTPFPENNIQQLLYNSKNHCLFSTARSDDEVKMPSIYGSKCSPNYLNIKNMRK